MSQTPDSVERVRKSLSVVAARDWTLGAGVVAQMEIVSVDTLRGHTARLDSLIEERYLRRLAREAPREAVASPDGTPPELAIWDVPVPEPRGFDGGVFNHEVPGTERVTICGMCHREKKVTCHACGGGGMRGHRTPCGTCGGSGLGTCNLCNPDGLVLELAAIEVMRRLDQRLITDRGLDVPAELLLRARGEVVLDLDAPQLAAAALEPWEQGYRAAGAESAARFDEAMRSLLSAEIASVGSRVVRQRLLVQEVPVECVGYTWRSRACRCWIVGLDALVHSSDPPFASRWLPRTLNGAFGTLRKLFA